MNEELTLELLKTLKHGHVDADKIANTCASKDVDIGHVILMAENLRDMLIKEHDRTVEILNNIKKYNDSDY